MRKDINKHPSQEPEILPGTSNQGQTRRSNPPNQQSSRKTRMEGVTEPERPGEVLTEDTVQLRGDRSGLEGSQQ
ncbi:hypothetical protein TNCV_1927801 [Trichonephila clavipes]|nr:hypothetical protein TNCV_1927801 [Trichonephila clavipes]